MTACVPVTQEKIRAEILMGGISLAKTPFVTNFNVTQSRNQISGTFSVTMDLIGGTAFPLGEKIVIKAGTKGNEKKIFTGVVENTSAQPAFGKPSYFTVTLSGRGVLSTLENKRFSRRLKAEGQGMFCLITGGGGNRPQSYYNLDKRVNAGNHQTIAEFPNPAAKGLGENSPFIVYDESSSNQSTGGTAARLAGTGVGGDEDRGTGGTGDFRSHTHENLEEGGPAFAVYSAD